MMINDSGPTRASCSSAVVINHSPGRAVQPPLSNSPREQITWESLALASGFRPRLLARRCGVSLRTLERHFIKHYRSTVSVSLRKMRLSLAYTRLQQGERIKSVCYDLGYKQLSHFSRDFKSFHGVPPSAVQGGFPAFPEPFTIRK